MIIFLNNIYALNIFLNPFIDQSEREVQDGSQKHMLFNQTVHVWDALQAS